jgi:predicted transcriptional regulator
MYTETQYATALTQFKNNNQVEAAKYASPHSDAIILAYLVQTQRLPTQTTVHIVIQELARKGLLVATSKNVATARAIALKSVDEALASAEKDPITPAEELHAASLSFAELQRLYWGEDLTATDYFSARYRKLARERGYQIPARPVVDEEAGEAVALSAEQYRSMPSSELQRRMRIPSFKMAVYKLIQQGLIAVLLSVLVGVIR